MMSLANAVLFCALLSANAGYGAEAPTSAKALAEMMQQAKYSDGFEVRLNVLVTHASGAHPPPFKLSVIGQMASDKQRLLIRGISPESVRNHFIAAERSSEGQIRAVKYRANEVVAAFDPQARMFDSGMVAWDMFAPWWSWPRQSLEGIERIKGRECEKIRSLTDDINSAVREVENCIDRQAKLSLRTRMFDAQHEVIRTTSVEHIMRKGKSGGSAAKKLTISDAAETHTELEVYAGDEEYQVTAETFVALDHLNGIESREAK